MSWIKYALAAIIIMLHGADTVVDGNFVTGQNQNSGCEISRRILKLLAAN